MKYRIGYGEDIHRLIEGRKLILGGIEIPFEKGLLGHSDADVVYHALSDAILGALALGDIGQYFRPDDESIEGIDSAKIVAFAVGKMKENGYRIGNVDIAIHAERPHVLRYVPAMKEKLAGLLETDVGNISIKGMSNEGLDAVGEGRAIRSVAVALLVGE